jgi:hypothetical protein
MQLPRVLISLEVDESREVHESPETIPASCARARFAGCTFMRHIILAIKGSDQWEGRGFGRSPNHYILVGEVVLDV